MAILSQPPMLEIVWNIAPNKITPNAIPGGTLRPQHPRMKPLDRGVAELVFGKARIENDDVAIRITHWRSALTIVSILTQGGGRQRGRHRSADKTAPAHCFGLCDELLAWCFQRGLASC